MTTTRAAEASDVRSKTLNTCWAVTSPGPLNNKIYKQIYTHRQTKYMWSRNSRRWDPSIGRERKATVCCKSVYKFYVCRSTSRRPIDRNCLKMPTIYNMKLIFKIRSLTLIFAWSDELFMNANAASTPPAVICRRHLSFEFINRYIRLTTNIS